MLESNAVGEDVEGEIEILQNINLDPAEKRFNEGMADPAGRFLAGTMGLRHGTHDGRMFALTKGLVGAKPMKEGITCTNGIAWIDGGATMYVPSLPNGIPLTSRYFTDSWDKKIEKYDYDVVSPL
jgi:sugar lactone lactonase YvrE